MGNVISIQGFKQCAGIAAKGTGVDAIKKPKNPLTEKSDSLLAPFFEFRGKAERGLAGQTARRGNLCRALFRLESIELQLQPRLFFEKLRLLDIALKEEPLFL